MSHPGLVGIPNLDSSTLSVSRRRSYSELDNHNSRHRQPARLPNGTEGLKPNEYELPPFIRILNLLLVHTQPEDTGSNNFISNVLALHDVAFSPKCPILGTGHHFAVYASPFDVSEHDFRPPDGRAFNNQVYCLKAPNFTSGENATSGPGKDAFRKEYYHTVLQELRVLLHPQLRSHDNIISLFGLDFQEDYDDCSIAWPVLLMENAEYGTLDTFQQDIYVDSELSRVLLLDVARGIQALHQCNIIHGDVKSENVLICRHQERPYVARLSDFGLSLINPDVASNTHSLPGGTFLWRAPEFDHELSVEGLRQTDVYSFGLMAWRVLVNNPNPYGLIPLATLGLQTANPLSAVVTRAKAHPAFTQLVLQTMEIAGVPQIYALRIIEATLGKDLTSRDLNRVMSALAIGRENMMLVLEPHETYWAMEEPHLVMEQLEVAFPDSILQFTLKASMIRSLLTDLETVFKFKGELARSAGWLLFKFAASPQFQVAWKDVDECCRILIQLCHLGSALGQAIVTRYHEVYGKKPDALESEWLEVAASNGSYYAIQSLRECYPENYLQLMGGPLDFEPRSADLDDDEVALLKCCRAGDYEACKIMLGAGASAFPSQEGMVSPLHWLVSFQEEQQINDVAERLLGNGAVLDAWEGEDGDLTFGRATGTPLHWAVWHRHIPAVRALTKAESHPEVKQVDRAIWIAATMHFYDVLEILKAWVLGLKDFALSDVDWYTPFLFAADQSTSWLPRQLRHGRNASSQAFEHTMDVVIEFYRPSAKDIKLIFAFAIGHNHPSLLRYMYKRLDLGKRKDILENPKTDPSVQVIAMGFIEVVEVFIEKGLIGPQSEHGAEKWRPLQLCCFTRQRDPTFARRLLEIGCPVDGVGSTEESNWTPFFIAVSLGMYQTAVIFLEHGANKDRLSGWMGGSTVTMNLLQSWPDIPSSRLKFLLEEIPRIGFGHVTFWGWPGAGGNLIYALSLHHWSSYSAGYRLGETAKYILSQLADKSCLNVIDKVGATALRMACANGNVEIIQALIEAGQDVNLAMGFSPLRNAKEWLATCQKREKEALKGKPGSERRLARQLRVRAEDTIKLLGSHGAIDRDFFEAMQNGRNYLTSGQWQKPSFETVFEMYSGVLDPSPRVEAGSTPLQPTTRAEFRAHHGKKSAAQKLLGNLGRQMDQANRQDVQPPTPRYQPHNCLPWRNDNCFSCSPPSHVPYQLAPASRSPFAQRTPLNPAALPDRNPVNETPRAIQWQPMNQGPSVPRDLAPTIPPVPRWQHAPSQPPTTRHLNLSQHSRNVQWQPANPDPAPLRTAEAVKEKLYHSLLHYFCEGGGEQASANQKRDDALGILRKELQAPVILSALHHDTEQCEEFSTIHKAVEGCLEIMHINGVTLVPELSDTGRELVIHVFS